MKLISPLEWPAEFPRKRDRKRGRFSTDRKDVSVYTAAERLRDELGRHGATNAELSAMLGVTKGGSVSHEWKGSDPGAVIRYDVGGKEYCLPCDTYDQLAQNIAAIAEHLKALRRVETYGVATAADLMSKFAALPPPTVLAPREPWWQVLGVTESTFEEVVRAAYRALAAKYHPDNPATGDHEMAARVNAAWEDYQARFKK